MKIKNFISGLALLGLAFASPAVAENYGSTPQVDLPELGSTGWGVKDRNVKKAFVDFLGVAHNSDGTLKSTTTASQWIVASTTVTYVSGTSFTVPDADATVFVTGRKAWVNQATDVIGVVDSTSSSAGFTTVVLSSVVLYSDNATASAVTTPITSVSVGIDTLRSDPSPKNTGRGGYSNLIVKRASVSTVDVNADSITLHSATATYDALSVNLTCDMATNLDTGLSESVSKWFSVWVSSDGTTETCIIDDGTADPADAGTYIRRVGWAYNNSSSDFWEYQQIGNRWKHIGSGVMSRDPYINAITSDTYLLYSPTVPSTAREIYAQNTATGGNQSTDVSTDGTNILYELTAQALGRSNSVTWIPLDSNNQHYAKRAVASSTSTVACLGFIDNL